MRYTLSQEEEDIQDIWIQTLDEMLDTFYIKTKGDSPNDRHSIIYVLGMLDWNRDVSALPGTTSYMIRNMTSCMTSHLKEVGGEYEVTWEVSSSGPDIEIKLSARPW